MGTPSVAIVGRANVGKSCLFNALCGERVAIVHSEPGVTRDRVARQVELGGRALELVDTGGVGMESAEEIATDVDTQIQIAITQADLVLLVVDVRAGIQPLDRRIARRLRRAGKEGVVVVNKADDEEVARDAVEFYELGFGEPLPVSAEHRRGLEGLIERILGELPHAEEAAQAGREPLKMAIVGRRNAGKSTFINYLADEPRVVVSEMPGTTRDSVDVRIHLEPDGRAMDFVAIDTAGIRKRRQLRESVDFYSQVRTVRAIKRADVVVHMIDATREVTRVDRQLAEQVRSHYKPCVLALNKSDLIPEEVADREFEQYVWMRLPGLRFSPLVFLSALHGENALPLLNIVHTLHEEAGRRVRTSELNEVMEEISAAKPPPSRGAGAGNILYATQVEVHPPTVALFVNDVTSISDDYERYLANQIRRRLPFSHVPIRFVVRRRAREAAGGER